MSTSNPSAADARAGARRRTLFRGRICWGPHATLSIDCTIRDLSESGAQLRVPAAQAMPSSFTLIHILEGIAYEASLAWRRGDLAGVKFAATHDLKKPGEPQMFDVRQIWLALAPS
jgi:hypothetical protein